MQGKGDGEPGALDIQSITVHDSDGTGSDSEPDSPDSQRAELNNGDSAGDGNGIKDGGKLKVIMKPGITPAWKAIRNPCILKEPI